MVLKSEKRMKWYVWSLIQMKKKTKKNYDGRGWLWCVCIDVCVAYFFLKKWLLIVKLLNINECSFVCLLWYAFHSVRQLISLSVCMSGCLSIFCFQLTVVYALLLSFTYKIMTNKMREKKKINTGVFSILCCHLTYNFNISTFLRLFVYFCWWFCFFSLFLHFKLNDLMMVFSFLSFFLFYLRWFYSAILLFCYFGAYSEDQCGF